MNPDFLIPERDPDLRIMGLRMWEVGPPGPSREFTAHYAGANAEVWVKGVAIEDNELARFKNDMEDLRKNLNGTAALGNSPRLRLNIVGDARGGLEIYVEISPYSADQKHWFRSTADQTYLSGFIRDCKGLLEDRVLRDGESAAIAEENRPENPIL